MRWHAPLPGVSRSRDSGRHDGPCRDRRDARLRHVAARPVALVARRATRPPSARAIHRPRLTGPLTEAAPAARGDLVAPAGYGKTTLLYDWAEHDERPFAWVTLDREDNDPACLRASVAVAAESVAPQRGTGRFVLVLDDLQALHAPAAHGRARGPARAACPHEVTLALASRDRRRRCPSRACARRAASPSSGRASWPWTPTRAAALLALRRGAARRRGRRAAAGRHRGLAGRARARGRRSASRARRLRRRPTAWSPSTCATRCCAELAPERLRLLLETSVLETLTGPLCDCVLERDGSAAALVELCRAERPAGPARPRRRALPPSPAAGGDAARRAAAPRPGARGRAAPPRRRLVPRRRRRRPRRPPRGARRRPRPAGELVWRATLAAVSRGAKQTAEAWLEPVHRRRARRHADARARLRGRRRSSPARAILPSTGCWPRPRSAPLRPRSRRASTWCARRSRATAWPRMRADAEQAHELAPEGSPGRAVACLLAGTAARLAGDEDAADAARGGRPSRRGQRARHPRALPDAARDPRARARGLGGSRRAGHTRARAGRAPRPRRLSRPPRSCSRCRRSCARTAGASRAPSATSPTRSPARAADRLRGLVRGRAVRRAGARGRPAQRRQRRPRAADRREPLDRAARRRGDARGVARGVVGPARRRRRAPRRRR